MDQFSRQNAQAITFPQTSGSNQHLQSLQQPRQPHNLQGLLRFAMEATKAEDAPGNSTLGPMDEESKKFLEEALKSLTVDIAKVLQDCIKVLSDIEKIKSISCEEEPPEDVRVAFSNLLEFIDDIDIANDFYKLGGFAIFPVCYGSENPIIRSRASTLLAELCQNNPYCQARTLECGLLSILLNILSNEENEQVLIKTMYAVSCAVRDFDPNCQELLKQNGIDILLKGLRSSCVTLQTKSAFLITYLCKTYPQVKKQFVIEGVVQHLTENISKGRDESSEHILSALHSLVEDNEEYILNICREPELKMNSVLNKHLQDPVLGGNTDYIEERDYCKDILQIVFSNYKCEASDVKNDNSVDR